MMFKIMELLKQGPWIISIAVLAYFGKIYIENKFGELTVQVNEINKSSLSIKEDLRTEERKALIEFRVALEKWEHFLLPGLVNFSTRKIDNDSINAYYDEEDKLQLAVKIAVAKLEIVLRNDEIYLQAQPMIENVSAIYHPFINTYLPLLIDLQAEEEMVEFRMKEFDKSMKEGKESAYTVEQAKKDQLLMHSINQRKTELVRTYSEELLKVYPKLSGQLTDLKIAMQAHVYRPLSSVNINED